MKNVKNRYSKASQEREEALCCPVDYQKKYLEIIPQEVIERDYGCGDPSRYVREGDTVLDLGSGGGKICFIAAQIVGKTGSVIGVDMTPDMLALARKHQSAVEEKMGYHNLQFKYGQIQDLQLSLDEVEKYLQEHPITSAEEFQQFEEAKQQMRNESPLIADDSVDIIISNCVLNLVHDEQKKHLFHEMHRVLKRGGRIAISDIVSDEPSPKHLKNDPKLWSGCISGALQEHEFVRMLEEVGFYGIAIDTYSEQPWQIVEGIEYRSVTVTAYKGKEGPCVEKNQAVIYKGPWKTVQDDDHHTYYRGRRMAVCDKTFGILTKEPYASDFIPVLPHQSVKEETLFDCKRSSFRDPQETKRGMKKITTDPSQLCADGDCC